MSAVEWEWLTTEQLSERTGIAVKTLQNQRAERRGCPYHRVPGTRVVMYHIDDVNKWISADRQETRAA